jgi:hypothetical protein
MIPVLLSTFGAAREFILFHSEGVGTMKPRVLLFVALVTLIVLAFSCANQASTRVPLSPSQIDSSLLHANLLLGAGNIDSPKSLFAGVRDEERSNLGTLVECQCVLQSEKARCRSSAAVDRRQPMRILFS